MVSAMTPLIRGVYPRAYGETEEKPRAEQPF